MTLPLGCWEQMFRECQPVAHWLREALSDRWVRFHSLPGSKRYAEEEAEYATILDRHNRILEDLIGSERSLVLLSTGDSELPVATRSQPELEALDPQAKPWRSIPMHEFDAEFIPPSFWHVFASTWDWRQGLFDRIIRLVADDVLWNIMIIDSAGRWLFHPYDGGMDVIAESSVARDRLKLCFANWLSPRPDGL